jgi:hypothetical protein
MTHKLFFIGTNSFVIFDFPGSTYLSQRVNRRGFIAGRHLDAAGIEHGILARIRPGRADKAVNEMRANNLPVSPVKPAPPAPAARQNLVPTSQAQFLSRNCCLIETSKVVGKSDPIRKENYHYETKTPVC